jgi:hypothetical protein
MRLFYRGNNAGDIGVPIVISGSKFYAIPLFKFNTEFVKYMYLAATDNLLKLEK